MGARVRAARWLVPIGGAIIAAAVLGSSARQASGSVAEGLDARRAAAAGACSSAAIDKKNYSGKTLNILTHAIPVMGEPTELHAKQFAKLTGAKVNVVHAAFGDLFQKMMVPFQTGQNAFDVMFYGSLWIGDVQQFLEPVPAKYRDMPQMQDVTANYKAVATWGGKMVQFPVDGDRHYLKYRTDIINSPKWKQRYKEKTGRILRVPTTWKEYAQIAKFFNGYDWDGDGKKNYGSAEIMARDDLMFSAFISRVAAYARNPKVKGGFYFDLKTMKPQVNNPGWVEGLKDFVDALSYIPPGGQSFGLGDEIFSFGGGQTLFSYTWDDAFVQAQQQDSRIKGKVGAAPHPGSKTVWNRNTGRWDKFATPNRAPYVTWGWSSAVAKGSSNKEMAFDYLCFFANPENHRSDLLIGRFGVNPFRKSDASVDFWSKQAGWGPAVAKTYIQTLNFIDNSKTRVFDLRVPGVQQYMTALATGVSKALAKQATPKQALDGVAKEWEKTTKQHGVDGQRRAYATIVALEDGR